MYAIIDDNGRQYKVEQGQRILVDLKDAAIGELIEFDRVLLVGGEGDTRIGNPTLLNARVIAEVMREQKGPKVLNLKFRRRKASKRLRGHRQRYSEVLVREIHPE
jgi:large subunit ribosomal protein L21